MQELALQDDQLLLGQPRLLGLVPQLVKLLVLEETSPEDETKLKKKHFSLKVKSTTENSSLSPKT